VSEARAGVEAWKRFWDLAVRLSEENRRMAIERWRRGRRG